ncbi:MAG: DUF1045 domain-containing protein [Methyloceanibacter sp.]|nr:DUF1045 domain-containing protein [Methyloceanibacter sp.]
MLNSTQHEQHHKAAIEPIAASPTLFSICYTPRPGSPLALFGRSWFGRANDGTAFQAFSSSGIRSDAPSGISRTPGRYFGLHAPFFASSSLRAGMRLEEIRTHLESFAAHRKPIETGPLTLARVRRSLVLQPAEPQPELNWLALQCFNAFDGYAAATAISEDEHQHLSPHQRLLLKSFGQPNVMSEYRFSLGLTGPLEDNQLERVSHALRPLIEPFCTEGVCVDGLSFIGSPNDKACDEAPGRSPRSPLRLLGRFALGG